jgi:hypothetical protein
MKSSARRCLTAFTLGVMVVGVARPNEFTLPPISGELSGEVKPLQVPNAPRLKWTVAVQPAEKSSEARVVNATLQGEGTRLRANLNLTAKAQGTWQIEEGEIDVATWFSAATELDPTALSGLTAKGTAQLQGGGAVREGQPEGTVTVTIRQGRLENATAGWALEGVALTAELLVEAHGLRVRSVKPFDLTIATITTPRFGARNVFVRGLLKENHTIEFSEARVEIAGGAVTLEPTTLTFSPMAVEAMLHIANVGMEDIAALVPAGLSAAHGRIDGDVRLGWSADGGFRVGKGDLTLGHSEPATVQLAPTPGFLTRTMPKRFEPLPAWTGPLSKWLSADNPVYTDMEAIELGRAPLRVESLQVRLTPEGDEYGRTATVRMVARPVKADAGVKSVNIDVNVAGPLDALFEFGINQKYSIEAH